MMEMIVSELEISAVACAVKDGLSKTPKRLPSWLFYDEAGDKLFQAIADMPSYYLFKCEQEILSESRRVIFESINKGGSVSNVIELGSGNGHKTEILLKYFAQKELAIKYYPVDISHSVLEELKERLNGSLPNLDIYPVVGRYDQVLEQFRPKFGKSLFLFLGANIGNYSIAAAIELLRKISASMNSGDLLLIGFDLKKDPRLIEAAYNDPQGITRDFNLNLLKRLNRDLGANFDTDLFRHFPYYDPESGTTKSFLISTSDQTVHFEALQTSFQFEQWESIHTEVSQKYDIKMIREAANQSGLDIAEFFFDSRKYFCDVLMRKNCQQNKFALR